jgi:hypothetical protein
MKPPSIPAPEGMKFCVYHHLRPDGTVFYVGMGGPERPGTYKGRTGRWRAIASQGWTSKVVEWFAAEAEAAAREQADIRVLQPQANVHLKTAKRGSPRLARNVPPVAFRLTNAEREPCLAAAKGLGVSLNELARRALLDELQRIGARAPHVEYDE